MDDHEYLNADDFVDTPPNRNECRRLLEEIKGDAGRISAWNRMMDRFVTKHVLRLDDKKWRPPLSQEADPWVPVKINLYHSDNLSASLRNSSLNHTLFYDACLTGVDFTGASIKNSDVSNTKLRFAKLTVTNMDSSKLARCDFTGASMTATSFEKTVFQSVDFRPSVSLRLNFTDSTFIDSNTTKHVSPYRDSVRVQRLPPILRKLRYSKAIDSWHLIRELLRKKNNRVVFSYTMFDRADIRGLIGFTPNGESVQGARFHPNASDPYSILRRKYTGPMLFFHIILIAIFFIPYIMKAGAWTLVEKTQTAMIEQGLDSGLGAGTLADSEHFAQHGVWWVVLGFREGAQGWAMGAIAILFIFYNIVRVYVTHRMSLLRDAEERSGYLPEMKEYWTCFNWHRYFLVWVYLLAMGSFLIHFGSWMLDTVYVPTAMGG